MTPELFLHITAIWHLQTEAFFQRVRPQTGIVEDVQSLLSNLEMSLLSLKCLRQLYVFGVEKYEATNEIMVRTLPPFLLSSWKTTMEKKME